MGWVTLTSKLFKFPLCTENQPASLCIDVLINKRVFKKNSSPDDLKCYGQDVAID